MAPDGSPVEIYLALPAGEVPALIDSVLEPASSILELGSGVGRVSSPLVDLGHEVVAVDNSPEMLAHVRGEKVLADIFTLDLGRRFDAVIAGSHLINSPDPVRRHDLLRVCADHLRPGGVVLVERYPTAWADGPSAGESQAGAVRVAFEPIEVGPARFTGKVSYTLGSKTWVQVFEGANVTDTMLEAEAAESGLRLDGWIDEGRTWARLQLGA